MFSTIHWKSYYSFCIFLRLVGNVIIRQTIPARMKNRTSSTENDPPVDIIKIPNATETRPQIRAAHFCTVERFFFDAFPSSKNSFFEVLVALWMSNEPKMRNIGTPTIQMYGMKYIGEILYSNPSPIIPKPQMAKQNIPTPEMKMPTNLFGWTSVIPWSSLVVSISGSMSLFNLVSHIFIPQHYSVRFFHGFMIIPWHGEHDTPKDTLREVQSQSSPKSSMCEGLRRICPHPQR